ncbi:uncharacterized protein IL334_007355 [Kwoniella shivajii]|uniref:Arrestin C-terminal-like domain-containing protein n=1 Tax=Kwoniella shivajii TaxID=564305 RepID=A0ABZ1D8F1_9TREE|nr:hypothetical protein IL334_007355 [Kwoniella shivajii]
MSHPARLSLRAPPHLPFIQGYPGIPASGNRKSAGVHGTLELRVGTTPVKAKWVRVEIRKYEILPPGFPGGGSFNNHNNGNHELVWEHIGDIQTLWKPSSSSSSATSTSVSKSTSTSTTNGNGDECEIIETSDFKFFLPLPEHIPPTIELQKDSGIKYELVAALCYRQKGGMFKKESYPILKISESILITKHELHSTWPIYQIPSTISSNDQPQTPTATTASNNNGQLVLNVSRPNRAFGSGDKIQFSASLKSTKSQPFKLKGFECTMYEIITSIPSPPPTQPNGNTNVKDKKRKSMLNPISRSRAVATVKAAIDEKINLGGERSARIEMLIDRVQSTTTNARSLKVSYELEVKAVMEGIKDKIQVNGIVYTVGVYSKTHAENAVRDIGYVEALCPKPASPPPKPPPIDSTPFSGSQPDLPPGSTPYPPTAFTPPRTSSQQQGFIPRQDFQRHISGNTLNSINTFSTTTSGPGEFGLIPGQSHRPYITMPLSHGQGQGQGQGHRRGEVLFPNPQPARPRSITPTSPTIESSGDHERYAQSDVGHDNASRYSTATMATFGRWDNGLKNAMVSPGIDGGGTMASPTSSDNTTTPTSPIVPSTSTAQSPPSGLASRSVSTRPSVPPPSSFYLSAEQEKHLQRDRYESARTKAISAQTGLGVSLDQVGLAGPSPSSLSLASSPSSKIPNLDEEEAPPPEYAPPIPAQPKQQYTAPTRPVSEYTNGSSIKSNSTPASPAATITSLPSVSNRVASPPLEKQGFSSAAEEKEIQRKRYEEATSKMSKRMSSESGSVGSSSTMSGTPNRHSSIIQQLNPTPPSQPSQSNDNPLPYEAIHASESSSSAIRPRANVGLGISSGLSEKEQMRRYYAAQDAVAQNATGSDSGGNTSPGRMTSIGTNSVLSKRLGSDGMSLPYNVDSGSNGSMRGVINASNEKEQMRRFYEAQEKVSRAQTQFPVAGPSNTVNTPSSSPKPRHSMGTGPGGSAISEKEQMRRYYEAQDKVAAASSSSQGQGQGQVQSPSSYTDSKSENSPPRNVAPNGMDEKEQMRRYYDAQEKVSLANGSPSQPQSAKIPSASTPMNAKPSGSILNARDEKEQMKRYYEAMDKVQNASTNNHSRLGSGSGSGSGSRSGSGVQSGNNPFADPVDRVDSLPPILSPPVDSPPVDSPPVDSLPAFDTPSSPPMASGSTHTDTQSTNAGHVSAEQEKEIMRKRYEQATSAVERHSSPSPISSPSLVKNVNGPRTSLGLASQQLISSVNTPSASPTTTSTTTHTGIEKHSPRLISRNTTVSPPDSPLMRDPTVKAGKAKASQTQIQTQIQNRPPAQIDSDAPPPPPLPARPPKEYVELLSPV